MNWLNSVLKRLGLQLDHNFSLKNNKFLKRVFFGIKSGWELPILPEHISKMDKNIYVRIFKIIGAISVFIILSKIAGPPAKLNDLIYYVIFTISILFILYKYVIMFYVIKQWIHNLIKGNFIVKNSPFAGKPAIASILKGSTSTLRTVTNFTVGAGFTYALCHELDAILEKEGKEPYFVPGMKVIIEKSGLTEYMKVFLLKLGITDSMGKTAPTDYNNVHNVLKNLGVDERKTFEKDTGISYEAWRKGYDYLENNKNKLSQELKDYIETDDPFGNRKK